MTRKEALITETFAHLAMDTACFFLLAGTFSQTAQTGLRIGAGMLLFALLSFGLRPLLGWFLDEFPKAHAQAVGCLLAAIGGILPAGWSWGALILAAVGSAVFHIGALGESLAFARGYFSRNGIFLAAGGFGAALGTVLGAGIKIPGWAFSLLLVLCALLCFFFGEARKYPRRIRSFRHSVSRKFPDWALLLLTLIPLLNASLTVSLLPSAWIKGSLILFPAGACLAGRVLGGICADRFGPRKTALLSFAVATVMLTVFTHSPVGYCLGLAALSAPVSISYGTATAALPEKPHFAAGICSLVLLGGALPGFFPITAGENARFLCGILLVLSLGISLILYTDHTRIFPWRKRPVKAKGEPR